MADNFKYEVVTTPSADGKILQQTFSDFDGIRQRIMRGVIDTQEQQVRQALIQLGWTPPKEKGTANEQ